LTEVDPGISLPSRVPDSKRLPCSDYPTDRHSAGTTEGSSADQDEGWNKTPGFLGILIG